MSSAIPTEILKTAIRELIAKWKLNKTLLAAKMNMAVSTFKNKLNETNGLYKFTDDELFLLTELLGEMIADTEASLVNSYLL